MANEKQQILADFQSCTGIEDDAECIMHLESADWNLLAAIHNVMPDESQELPSERMIESSPELNNKATTSASGDSVSMKGQDNPKQGNSNQENSNQGNSNQENSSTPMDVICINEDGPSQPPPPRLLQFEIHFNENLLPLEVPDSETVGSIKAALHAELGVPPCRQELYGWRRNQITDDSVLSSLQLPSLTHLFLTARDALGFALSGQQLHYDDALTKKYLLHVIDTANNKEYDLYFPGSKTVLEVKLGLRDVTNIPVRFQQWVGWPEAAVKDESIRLASLDLESPFILILNREENVKPKKPLVVDVTSSESSENEFEDPSDCYGLYDDDMFNTNNMSKKNLPLIPEDIEDEATAVHHFRREFANRYGSDHPEFFQGTLSEAIQASCNKPAKERQPLVIYLHNDSSVLANVFCTQFLCSESIISYLALNFVTWAWDLTHEANKCRFLSSLSLQLGVNATGAIKNIPIDHLPALMVVIKIRSSSEVLTVIPGTTSLDELMTRLVHAVDVFKNDVASEIREEVMETVQEEREARERVKQEQDAAYEASLMADRAKEEARRQEEEEKVKKNKEQQKQKAVEEKLRLQEEELKKAVQKSLADQLPPEPEEDSNEEICHIRVRLPNGIFMHRRFLASDPLQLLLTYIGSQGYPMENYKVLSSWPRRDLTTLDTACSLGDLKLYPKDTLTLEER